MDLANIHLAHIFQLEDDLRAGPIDHFNNAALRFFREALPGLRIFIPGNFAPPAQHAIYELEWRDDSADYTRRLFRILAEHMGIGFVFDHPRLPRRALMQLPESSSSSEDEDDDIVIVEEDIIVLPVERAAEPVELEKSRNLDRNQTIDILPYHEVIENTHRLLTSTISSQKIDNLAENLVQEKAFLTYCKNRRRFAVCQILSDGGAAGKSKLKNSPWKSSCWFQADCLAEFGEEVFDGEQLRISTRMAKQFKAIEIEVFWSFTNEELLKIDFYLNISKIPQSFQDAVPNLSKLCQSQIPSKLNEFLRASRKPVKFWTFSQDLTKASEIDSNYQPFFVELEKCTKSWENAENWDIREDLLKCRLMKYQRKTIKWMIDREIRQNRIDSFDCFECIEFPPHLPNPENSTNVYYFPFFGLFAQSKLITPVFNKGGILADEMGLGKTIEMLALITTNRKGQNVFTLSEELEKAEERSPSPVSRPKIVSEDDLTRNRFNWNEYNSAKKVDKSNGSAVVFTVTDENLRKMPAENFANCSICEEHCVLAKCGWKKEFEGRFLCPQCMAKEPLLEVKTTLIVLPESLVLQWFDEISRHCSEKLKVMFYFGLNKNGYLHPQEIAKFDVVLTTYDTLRNELDFANYQNTSQSRLRHGQKSHKFSPTSITHVHWWRLVADESQLVEGSARRAPQMCTLITSQHRWCLTGTPIVKNVADLHGLFRFINFWPFNVEQFWKECVMAEYIDFSRQNLDLSQTWLLKFAGQLMRRNSKKMVESEIRLPKLIEIEKRLKFSQIEERQYKEELEKVKELVEKSIPRHVANDVMLSTMAGRERTLMALGKLRETLVSCGEHVNFHKQKNMYEQVIFGPETVMLRLIRAKKNQIEECLRAGISSLFAEAGTYWCYENLQEVEQIYEKVVAVMEKIEEHNQNFNNIMKLEFENFDEDNSDDDYGENDEDDPNFKEKPRNRAKRKRCARRILVKNELKELSNLRKVVTPAPGAKHKIAEENQEAAPGSEEKMPRIEGNQEEDAVEIEDDDEKEKVAAQRKAEKNRLDMERRAMRPIRLDCTMIAHFVMNTQQLSEKPEMAEKVKILWDKLGGKEAILKNYNAVIKRYAKVEHAGLHLIQQEYHTWQQEFGENRNDLNGIHDWIAEVKYIYLHQDKSLQYNLVDKVIVSTKLGPIISEMAYWPMFVNWKQHILDSVEPEKKEEEEPKIEKRSDKKGPRRKPHDKSRCMGQCIHTPFEHLIVPYERNTNYQFIDRIRGILSGIDFLKNLLLKNFYNLIYMFNGKSVTEILEFQQCGQIPEFLSDYNAVVRCKHSIIPNPDFKINVEEQTRLFPPHKCLLCQTRLVLANLRFDLGIGSIHGETKYGNGPLAKFISLVMSFEKRSDASLQHLKHIATFKAFLDRLRRFIQYCESSCVVIQEYCNRLNELEYAQQRVNILQLRNSFKQWYNTPLMELRDKVVNAYHQDFVAKEARVITACQELRYLAFLYDKEKRGTSDGDDNICLVCGTNMESMVVYPCGHRLCEDCYREIQKMLDRENQRLAALARYNENRNQIECVTCRRKFNPRQLMVARAASDAKNRENLAIPGITLAVKLEQTIRICKQIIQENSQNKIILFTTLEIGTHIWRFLLKVLQKAKMPFIEISRSEYGKRVFTFEFSDSTKILLCSLSMCANGLNLTQANHIIFLDPTHLSSVVAQAIGRISRYGQCREMKVYHMIVESSIDEELRRIATSEGQEAGLLQQKERSGWTIGEIRQIFGIAH